MKATRSIDPLGAREVVIHRDRRRRNHTGGGGGSGGPGECGESSSRLESERRDVLGPVDTAESPESEPSGAKIHADEDISSRGETKRRNRGSAESDFCPL